MSNSMAMLSSVLSEKNVCQILPQSAIDKLTWITISQIKSPKSEPTLELNSRAAPRVEAHHHVSSSNTGKNYVGRRIIKKSHKYYGDLNTGLARYLNGQNKSELRMVKICNGILKIGPSWWPIPIGNWTPTGLLKQVAVRYATAWKEKITTGFEPGIAGIRNRRLAICAISPHLIYAHMLDLDKTCIE